MPSNRLSFTNRHGQDLAARLDLPPDGEPKAYALFAHCFTCSKDLKAARNIAQALTQAGLGVLRFDFTGLGQSEGDFADTHFSSNVEDLLDAAAFLADAYAAPQLLIGHSLGGAAVLMAAPKLESVRAVATLGAPAEPEHVKHLIQDETGKLESEGIAQVSIGGRPFTVKKAFLEDLERSTLVENLDSLRKALLVLHSPIDNTVSVDNAATIFTAAKHPKSYASLDNADHLLSREADSRYAGEVIAAWSAKYLDAPNKPSWRDDLGDSRVVARTENGFRTEVMANGFGLVADEPLKVGGTNTGPTPYDYLATALATCTSMTLRMYADRKKWALETILTEVRHSKAHAQDCEDCEKSAKKLDHFERIITLTGDLDEAQQKRLLEIADRCPVHRTLESDVQIKTRLE